MDFLTGKDYPHLCQECQNTIDSVMPLIEEGPDTDDNEAPIMLVYDHGMFCGGHECVNKPKKCLYCNGNCPNDEDHACDGYLGDIDNLYKDEKE